MVNFVLKFLHFRYRGNRVFQNHTKRQMIANISHPFKEIVVAESEYLTVALKFYFWQTPVATVMNVFTEMDKTQLA